MYGIHLPFTVGQIVETMSYEKGYRGAWFRCKIRDIFRKKGEVLCKLEYLDFPEEDIHTEKLYQKGVDGNKKHLMARPKFPPIYGKNEAIDVKGVTETTLFVNDTFKVGDLIDWWKDDCYWSGTVVEVIGDGKFKIDLLPMPLGEGGCFEAHCNDMRPSLDWSLVNGWQVPSSKDGENRRCARLIEPANEGREEEEEDVGGTMKKQKVDESLHLNIMASNAIEAAVLDLEELVTRIRWMKAILSSDLEKSSSSSTSSWVFQEHLPSSTTTTR